MKTASVCFILACGCIFSASPSQAELDAVKCQNTVDSVLKLLEPCSSYYAYLRASKIQSDNPSMKELRNCLDPQKLLALLPRLSMQSGYCLDFVAKHGGHAFHPVFYARRIEAKSFDSFDSITNSHTGKVVESKYEFRWALHNKRVLPVYSGMFCEEMILADGSEEGFFQLTVLWLLGDQFLKRWHDYYHDDLIICAKAGLDGLFADVDSGRDPHWRIESGIRQKAYALDLKPSVQMDKKKATVEVVVFTKWGGFSRRSFVFQRTAPHRLLDGVSKELVRYDCGWKY